MHGATILHLTFIDDRQLLLTERAAAAALTSLTPQKRRAHKQGLCEYSALLLLVLGILTDNHDLPFSLDDLTLFANRFY